MQQSMQPGWGSAGHGPGSRPGAGAAGGTLAPGARIAGALVCAVLLAVEIAWTVRDVNASGLHDTVWEWLGLKLPGETGGVPATGGLDVVLAVVLAGALVAARRPAASWAFLAAGLFAAAYRVPGTWIFTARWTKGAPLHDRALTTAIVFVVGGVVLMLAALAGRVPAGTAGPYGGPAGAPGASTVPAAGPAPAPGSPAAGEPAAPAAVPALLGGLLLLVVAMETLGWQAYYVQKYDDPGFPPHLYKHLLTGETTITSLLAAPFAYAAWLTVALAVLAAVLAFRRVPAARPLGLALGLLVLLNGVVDLCSWHTEHLLFKDHLPDQALAEQGFAVFHVVAGLLLIVLLAQRATAPAVPPGVPGWTPQPPPAWQTGGQPPAWGSPYQQPHVPPGYQVPHQSPGAGAFGPPPELPPNLPPGTPPPPAGPPSGPPAGPASGSPGTPGSPGSSAPNRDWPSDSR
jgi:hypothetical protein